MKSLHVLFILASVAQANGQILFSQSFSVLLDSTKSIKGSITPEFKVQTQKKTLIEITNLTDMAIRLNKNSLTLANKIEFNKFGPDVFLSGGYIYANFRNNLDKHLSLEYFAQMHWAEARGLQRRYAAGPTLRWKIIKQQKLGLFVGTGPMYEYEEWNYDGVADEKLPPDLTAITKRAFKNATYVSYKHWATEKVFLDISLYHQTRYNQLNVPRFATSTQVAYSLSDHLQAVIMYQNIYDYDPVVPIDKLFHRFIATLAVSF